VDFTRGELRRGGRPLEISALEFKLLTAFIRNRGRLLPANSCWTRYGGEAWQSRNEWWITRFRVSAKRSSPTPPSRASWSACEDWGS
jgi:DNA-binding response OmpR family regulator